MVYQPSKEYLFNRILWAAFLPAFYTLMACKNWNPAGFGHNIFQIIALPLVWWIFFDLALTILLVYRGQLWLDQEGLGVSRSGQEIKIKWEEITAIGVWQGYWLFVFRPTLVVSSRTKEFHFNLSLLSRADCQKLKEELTAKLGPNGVSPAFD
ncbi:MAG: hypothetical protein A2663_04485 [Candidatus Buchananbacteria bacterium RIFCSPHIGHO2_01_FULL_46_12]|uniref:DUF304 domain-containing protein n=2 Tax=Candidatus Buchananiibacteriota TaxID=1817903 RepID=A0A1G1Y691_9BACT|nr:MAG: hypothetical protein A2663_04485 [Candidatus Buchananbacteria bacterium RIFCSPHIGHO2_01_FULL_46_12]OGY57098.1 MAG: hypothetical protein A3H67_02025 [Candidatus Buchananbacteria bacterium RIFCSPLOWO2_02_FULL_46_11b]